MLSTPLTPLAAAVRTFDVTNVSSFSRDLVLAVLYFMRTSVFAVHFLPPSLSSSCFPSLLPSFFRRSGCSAPKIPRLLHRHHLCLLACVLCAFLLSSTRVPCFPRRWCARLPRKTISLCSGASQPVDAVERLALSASTDQNIIMSASKLSEHVKRYRLEHWL